MIITWILTLFNIPLALQNNNISIITNLKWLTIMILFNSALIIAFNRNISWERMNQFLPLLFSTGINPIIADSGLMFHAFYLLQFISISSFCLFFFKVAVSQFRLRNILDLNFLSFSIIKFYSVTISRFLQTKAMKFIWNSYRIHFLNTTKKQHER